METLVFATGLLMGAVAIISVCAVWVRSHNFGVGGSVLSFVGVVLVGLSLWSTVEISTPDGAKAKFVKEKTMRAELPEEDGGLDEAGGEEAHVVTIVDDKYTLASECDMEWVEDAPLSEDAPERTMQAAHLIQ